MKGKFSKNIENISETIRGGGGGEAGTYHTCLGY